MHWLCRFSHKGLWPPVPRPGGRLRQRGRQLVGFPVLDADGGEDTAEYMRFHRLFPVDLFHLREYAHAGLCLVPVLCGEDFLHLVVKVVLFTISIMRWMTW